MQALGIKQFQDKKFKWLGIDGFWKLFLGNLVANFVGIVFGLSGQGKTEFCIQLAKYLCRFGRVAWLSYEQGHDSDLQMATIRNKMQEQTGLFITIDPLKKRKKGMSLYDELCDYLDKKSTPEFVFIDSLDYLCVNGQLTMEQYYHIKENYGKKRGIIFLAHELNGLPEMRIGKKIMFDGQFAVRVYKCIARKAKNRCGGNGNHVVYFKEARRADPLFFKKVEQEMEVIHNWEEEAAEPQKALEFKKALELILEQEKKREQEQLKKKELELKKKKELQTAN